MAKIVLLLILVINCNLLEAQNVGIGTLDAVYKFNVADRARLKHNVQTAGIHFDGTTLPTRSFIGMANNDYVGLYGVGSGWSFVMNVDNGNVGIGTTAPTSKLDVVGGFRLRSSNPNPGAVMTSMDDAGNAQWMKPIAFGVSGNNNLANFTIIANNTWNKVAFSSVADYNVGFAWQPVNQVFQAPLKGNYHFGVHLQHTMSVAQSKVRLVRRRGNIDTQVYLMEMLLFGNGYPKVNSRPYDISVDIPLEASDQVWLEINAGYINNATFFGDKRMLSFNGRLVSVQ